ncbi:hypothetical protein, partial [Streptomyces sp. ADI92-24]|uniref:hypothetical protein n=1 Tax=Streptomyces sp. ADI92-24 TaxID=1522756 RepID=UPI0013DDA1FA
MTFHDHLRHLAESALASIPAAEAQDIYVVSFFIDNEADDPRQPTLTIGYNTEAQFRHTIADASDEAEARWNYAFWLQNELTVIADLTRDPEGAAARHQWISELGLWYDHEPTQPDDWMKTIGPTAALIEANFNQTCVQLARHLHDDGVIKSALGKQVPVVLHELEYYEGIARRTEAANPSGLADDFTAWVHNGRGIRTVPIPDSTITPRQHRSDARPGYPDDLGRGPRSCPARPVPVRGRT